MAIKKIKVGSTTHDIDAHVALNTNLDNLGGSASAGPVFMVKNVSSAGAPFVDYRTMPLNIDWGGTGITSNPSMRVNLESDSTDTVFKASPRPGISGILGLEHGGTNSGTSLVDAPVGAFIVKRETDAGVQYLGSREHISLYKVDDQVTGILGAENGGTGNNLSGYPNGAILCKQTSDSGHAYIDYYSKPLGVSMGGTEASTVSGARSNLGFSYSTSAPTSAPSTGAGAVCFVVDSGAALPVAEGGTGASTKVNAVKNLGMYPVGSVYITNTSTSPASYLGGTWECFDKELKGKLWDSTSTSGFWTYNSTNTESDSQVYAYVEGHKIHIRFDIHTKVEMGESSYNLGTLDYETMGFGSFPYSAIYAAAVSDGGNAVGYCRLDYASGVLQIVDINPKTDGNTLPAGAWLYLILEMPITTAAMYDRAVDRFHWKRTA